MNDPVYSQNYDRLNFSPAMPVLTIKLSRSDGSDRSIVFDALVDTSADGTLIPLDLLEAVGAPYVDRAYLRGITGRRKRVDLYVVAVEVGDNRVPGIRSVAVPPRELPILGRDVLNSLRLLLDGPTNSLEIYR